MSQEHTITPGDHIVRIAYRAGHSQVDAVWMHPTNAELRGARPDPGVLAPGDIVHVPAARPRVFDRLATRRTHTLVVHLPEPSIALKLLRSSFTPYAAVHCSADTDEGCASLVPDAQGSIIIDVGPFTGSVLLHYERQLEDLAVALLVPIEDDEGVRARLDNLGYMPGLAGTKPVAYSFRSAVEEFQCDHGLTVTGAAGEDTRAHLKTAHGA